jgi:hypothetical protein
MIVLVDTCGLAQRAACVDLAWYYQSYALRAAVVASVNVVI